MVTNKGIKQNMIDLTGVNYILPIATFVLVLVVVFAVLKKTGILGDNNFINAMVALVFGIIIISFSEVRSYLELVSPWFVVLVVLMFFVLFLGGFMLAKDITKIARPGLAWVFIALLAIAFIAIGYSHFGVRCDPLFLSIKNWLFRRDVSGSIILGVVALVVGIFMTRKFK